MNIFEDEKFKSMHNEQHEKLQELRNQKSTNDKHLTFGILTTIVCAAISITLILLAIFTPTAFPIALDIIIASLTALGAGAGISFIHEKAKDIKIHKAEMQKWFDKEMEIYTEETKAIMQEIKNNSSKTNQPIGKNQKQITIIKQPVDKTENSGIEQEKE